MAPTPGKPTGRKKAPKPGEAKASATASKKQAPTRKGWEFASFTKKSVEFNKLAAKLSLLIKETYGDTVSISQFEKLIASLHSMDASKKALVYIDIDAIELVKAFRKARDARDAERDSFRSDIAVADVEGGLEAAAELAATNDNDMST